MVKRWNSIFIVVQVALFVFAAVMALMVELPWISSLGLVVLGFAAIAVQFAPNKWTALWKISWPCALVFLAGVFVRMHRSAIDAYFALLILSPALIFFITAQRAELGKTKWNALAVFLGFVGTALLVASAYLDNLPGRFAFALGIGVALLVFCRVAFKLKAASIQIVNTFILLLVIFPLGDFLMRIRTTPKLGYPQKYFSYEAARHNPAGFAYWSRCYEEQWLGVAHEIMVKGPSSFMPLKFRPDSHTMFFNSLITINHKGFRGPEIPDEKGNTYRIVALGESTTFGVTMNEGERPWPDVLEQMIRERLHLSRRVEVINAGVPSATLPGNVARLTNEILSLNPDLIISYHGINGFYLLNPDMPRIMGKRPPRYQPRPLKLLADFEYGIKLNRYKEQQIRKAAEKPSKAVPPMDSEYAKAYERLIQIADTNHIRLVLANYSMAVNAHSPPAVINFYGSAMPGVREEINANIEHTEIVNKMVKEHTNVYFINTQPVLDGKSENFIDLVHFTQGGRQKMAELMFAGISNILETELSTNSVAVKAN